MALISVSGLEKYFADELLFSNVSFMIEENEKIGLVGANGAGKTTLFKILLDEYGYDGGDIVKNKNLKMGYVKQHMDLESDKTVMEELLEVYSDVTETEKELSKIADDIENGRGNIGDLIKRQNELNEYFEKRGGYMYKNIAASSLIGLGFSQNDFDTPFDKLSGGQKTRVVLCKILLSKANLLLLDEPTNHLDINAVTWLEGFLKDYKGAVIVISHDRYFLDKVTNKTFEIENEKLSVYNGNYSRYLDLKKERRKAEERKYINTKKEIDRIERIIEQQKRWNREKNIKTAESKQKVVDRLFEDLVKPESDAEEIHFEFETEQMSGNDCLLCENIGMAFGIKKIFENVNIDIKRGERVFLLGENGCGKTTLFKIITQQLKPLSGFVKLGTNVSIGYYDQQQENLDERKTVFDEIYDSYPDLGVTKIRNALAAFLFKGDDVFKQISTLSGGEKAKVSLLKLMLSKANLLLLDEPTNHLDIRSREALETAVLNYGGTVFAISHDRYFINKLSNRILYMQKEGLKQYNGNYDYFTEKFKDSDEKAEVKTKNDSRSEYKKQKEKESLLRKKKNRMQKIEAEIEKTEDEVLKLQTLLETEEYATDYIKAQQTAEQIEKLNSAALEMYEEYDNLSEEINSLQ